MRTTSSTSLRWTGLTSLLVMAASVSANAMSDRGLKLVKWNWTASDMDGIWDYKPKIAVNRASEPTQNLSVPNYVWGDGTPSHTTTKADAMVTGIFYGTDIYLLGSTDGGLTVHIDVDGRQQMATPRDGNIAAVTGLEFGWHRVTLTFPGGGQNPSGDAASFFNGANITTGLWTKAGSIETAKMKTETSAIGRADAEDVAEVNSFYTGTDGPQWTKMFHLGGGYGTKVVTEGYRAISGFGIAGLALYNENVEPEKQRWFNENASLSFMTPPNAAFMQLKGSTHNDRSYATIKIVPDPPYGAASFGVNLTQVYANTVTNAMVPLGPLKQYNVSMKVSDDSITFVFNNATFWFDTGDTAPGSGGKKVAAGTIAGAVIGCVAGLALIGALVLWLMRRRRARHVGGARHIGDFDDEGEVKRNGILGRLSNRFGKGGDNKSSKAKQFDIDGGSTPSLHDDPPRLEPFTSHQATGPVPTYPGPPPLIGYNSSNLGKFDDMMPSHTGRKNPPLSAVRGHHVMWGGSQTQRSMTAGARLPTDPEPEYHYERDGGGISVGTSAAGREIISVPPSYDQEWSSSPAAQEAAAGKSRSATGLSSMAEGWGSGHAGPSGFGAETITEEPSHMSPH